MKSTKAYRGLVTRKRDGFNGEKQIILPQNLLKEKVIPDPVLGNLYITLIGYFPKATFHYRERRWGCADNILFYCVSGKGWYQNKAGYCEIKANEFVIIPATDKYLRYGADSEDPWTLYWVHFCGRDLAHFNTLYAMEKFLTPSLLHPDPKRIEIWNDMYNTLEMGYSISNLSYANFCLYHFIASFIFPDSNFTKKKEENDSIVTQSIRYMRDHIDQQLSVDFFAARFDYSVSRFSTLFKQQTGMPPIDYFIQMKMQKACQLLDLTTIKIKDVAANVGYPDAFYFNRIFNKVIGSSPSAYRLAKKG